MLSLAGPELLDHVLELQEEGVSAGAVADYQRGAPRSIQDLLEEEVCLPFRSPIIKERPRLRRARTPVSGRTVRRSGRLAACVANVLASKSASFHLAVNVPHPKDQQHSNGLSELCR